MLTKRFNIMQMSLISGIIFALAFGVMLISELRSAYMVFQTAEQDERLVQLLETVEQIAHHHAVERGLTAGYLASLDYNQKAKVDAQRQKADVVNNALLDLLAQDWPESFHLNTKTKPLVALLRQKSSMRRQIDTGTAPSAFSFYSELNSTALQTLSIIAINVSDSKLAYELNSALLLALIKERIGQVRGKVNGALSKGVVSKEMQKEIEDWLGDKTKQTRFARSLMEDRFGNELRTIFNSPEANQFNDITQRMLIESPDFSSLPENTQWFALATRYIGKVKGLLDTQLALISEHSKSVKSYALSYITVVFIIAVLISAILIFFNTTLLRMLKKQLGILTTSLEKIAEEGDLTVTIDSRYQNELGAISQSINKTIGALKDLIVGLDNSISTGTYLSEKLDITTNDIVKDAASTEQKALQITQATQQVASASEQIAEATNSTLANSRDLEVSAHQVLEYNDSAREAVESLNASMQNMTKDAAEMASRLEKISSFLATINNLADQTNLLALNAAIEAARAGEQGRGFAVVADEVRNLASSSKQASEQISSLITELYSVSDSVVTSIEANASKSSQVLSNCESASTLSHEVGDKIKQVESLSNNVATAAEQQSISLSEVVAKVKDVHDAASRNRAIATELRQMFDDVKLNNETLQRTMDGFKIET